MRNYKLVALLNFMGFSDANLDTFTNRVYAAMFGNEFFPDLQAQLADLKTASVSFAELLAVSKNGSRLQQEQKNMAKQLLLQLLRDLCRDVNYEANADREKLLSSGYDIYGAGKKQQVYTVLKAA